MNPAWPVSVHRMTANLPTLPFTGERFVPGASGAIGEMWYEHWHRYHYVLPLVAGKKVLDVACGAGYGSALMSRRATDVCGVDISTAAITHASSMYANRANLQFFEASCTQLPFDSARFEVVVSFETIEHIAEQAEFLDEIKRVLKPDGVLILSCPNKSEYSDKRGFTNEFHVRELYRPELEALLAPRFARMRWLSQRNAYVSLIVPEQLENAGGESLTVSQTASDSPVAPLPALYDVVVAGNDALAVDSLPLRISVFSDAEEWAYNDYRDTYRKYVKSAHAEMDLRARCGAFEVALKTLQNEAATLDPVPPPAPAESWLVRTIKRLSG